jgi:hypothetical protein
MNEESICEHMVVIACPAVSPEHGPANALDGPFGGASAYVLPCLGDACVQPRALNVIRRF